MDALEFLHNVERFIGRDLSYEDGKSVIELFDEGCSDFQHVAELLMTREDFVRVYGPQGK